MEVLFIFSMALLVQLIGAAQTPCTSGDVQLLEEQDPMNRTVGFVQYCYDSEWRTICRGNNNVWYKQEGNVACGQLGYSDQGAATGSYCDGSATNNFVTINCNGGERSLQECTVQDASCPCNVTVPGLGSSGDHARAVCQPANCTNKEIRLVNGTTNREGRVEVCLNGRWGTVCNLIMRDEIASTVCTQLGLPSEGALIVDMFGPGTAPIYICLVTAQDMMTIDCIPMTTVNCTHSMDLGVVCQTYQELYEQIINQTINDTRQECPKSQPSDTISTVTISLFPTKTISSLQTVTLLPQSCDFSTDLSPTNTPTKVPSDRAPVTIIALGGATGVLVALLVAIVIGWICTCVFFRRKQSKQRIISYTLTHRLDNPIYDESIQLTTPTNYSSSGPTYESTDVNDVGGANYDVVVLTRTTAEITGPTPESVTDSDKHHDNEMKENDFHGAEQHMYAAVNITQKKKRPQPTDIAEEEPIFDEEYAVINRTGGKDHSTNVQVGIMTTRDFESGYGYEVPIKETPREIEIGEGEYSRLKH